MIRHHFNQCFFVYHFNQCFSQYLHIRISQVPGPKCRSAVGSILSEGDQRPSAELQERYEKSGFRIFTFPEVTHVVSSCFPFRTRLSVMLGVLRVYPRLGGYIKVSAAILKIFTCCHPLEIVVYRSYFSCVRAKALSVHRTNSDSDI